MRGCCVVYVCVCCVCMCGVIGVFACVLSCVFYGVGCVYVVCVVCVCGVRVCRGCVLGAF